MKRVTEQVAGDRAIGRRPGCRLSRIVRLLLCCTMSVGWPVAFAADPPPAQPTQPSAETGSPEKPPGAAPKRPANRLAKETSPYLLLHAHNPVDWYPWGPEALAKAKAENKLIFLSIGYSSCYWCHVMERESFSDDEIAALLNKQFVCIKVDREERPDLDEMYMTALRVYYQVIGSARGGGWPLSMFLTPDGKPVAGGTYLPPRDRMGQDGFLSVLGRIDKLWQQQPQTVADSANQLAELVRQTLRRRLSLTAQLPDAELLEAMQASLAEQFDPQHGGFGFSADVPQRPKFPEPTNLEFLLSRLSRPPRDTDAARHMLVLTLEQMAEGGIRDHLGGGFHRYSTDRFWRIPHFEKMLYDNAQLASVYARASVELNRPDFRQVAEGILEFVLRDLTSPEGGFYSALDAETDGEEGRYYVWEKIELKQHLPPVEFEPFAVAYGILREPNFDGRYCLVRTGLPADASGATRAEADAALRPQRQKLLEVRRQRQAPLTDTKVLCAWNGLMIRGLADSGRWLQAPRYTQAAARAAELILSKLQTAEGRLLRTYSGGQGKLNGYLDDYALLIDGLIALHQATGEARWLEAADHLTAQQLKWFWDEEAGGFYYTSSDHEALFARSKDPLDGATPSPSAVSVSNLVYLAQKLPRPDYRPRAEKTLLDVAPLMQRVPAGMPRMGLALAEYLATVTTAGNVNPPQIKAAP